MAEQLSSSELRSRFRKARRKSRRSSGLRRTDSGSLAKSASSSGEVTTTTVSVSPRGTVQSVEGDRSGTSLREGDRTGGGRSTKSVAQEPDLTPTKTRVEGEKIVGRVEDGRVKTVSDSRVNQNNVLSIDRGRLVLTSRPLSRELGVVRPPTPSEQAGTQAVSSLEVGSRLERGRFVFEQQERRAAQEQRRIAAQSYRASVEDALAPVTRAGIRRGRRGVLQTVESRRTGDFGEFVKGSANIGAGLAQGVAGQIIDPVQVSVFPSREQRALLSSDLALTSPGLQERIRARNLEAGFIIGGGVAGGRSVVRSTGVTAPVVRPVGTRVGRTRVVSVTGDAPAPIITSRVRPTLARFPTGERVGGRSARLDTRTPQDVIFGRPRGRFVVLEEPKALVQETLVPSAGRSARRVSPEEALRLDTRTTKLGEARSIVRDEFVAPFDVGVAKKSFSTRFGPVEVTKPTRQQSLRSFPSEEVVRPPTPSEPKGLLASRRAEFGVTRQVGRSVPKIPQAPRVTSFARSAGRGVVRSRPPTSLTRAAPSLAGAVISDRESLSRVRTGQFLTPNVRVGLSSGVVPAQRASVDTGLRTAQLSGLSTVQTSSFARPAPSPSPNIATGASTRFGPVEVTKPTFRPKRLPPSLPKPDFKLSKAFERSKERKKGQEFRFRRSITGILTGKRGKRAKEGFTGFELR